jgi:hypothetical protein
MKLTSTKLASLVVPAGLATLLLAPPGRAAETWEIDPVHSLGTLQDQALSAPRADEAASRCLAL